MYTTDTEPDYLDALDESPLFILDFAVPADSPHTWTAFHDLAWAVLRRAVDDVLGQVTSAGLTPTERVEALAYLMSDDESYAYSAVNLCHHLSIDIAKLRAFVSARREVKQAA
jgi:hypothetical protein